MLTYVFENSKLPLYEQIYKFIKADITSGVLKKDDKLPSKRAFAENNGISTITIQNAYDQLISEGYIYTIPKKGYYVSDIEKISSVPDNAAVLPDISLPPEPDEYKYNLSGNKVSPDNFPFTVWAKLLRETISGKSRELMDASPAGGIYELRLAIAEHLKSFRGMLVDPDQIIIGAGTEYLYGLLVQLLGNDKIFCVENPGHTKAYKVYTRHEVKCRYGSLDDSGITVKALKKAKADIAHISPNHHFPTGITMPASRRYDILAWANDKKDRYVIEDDYDSEFRTNGKPLPTLFSIDAGEKVIYMNTFSKSLSPTIRISYMILPAHLVNRFYSELSFYSCTVSNFEQYTLAEFIKRGYFEKHINRMRLYYSRRRSELLKCIEKSRLRKICTIKENESGLHFLIKLDTMLSEQEAQEKMKKKGILLRPVSDYWLSPKPGKEHYYIVCYSDIELDDMTNVFNRIYDCLK